MRSKDTELMRRILEYVSEFVIRRHTSPSTAEIGRQFGINKSTAYRYLVEMDEKGLISYNHRTIETKITEAAHDVTTAAVYDGEIPCGAANEIEGRVEEYVPLPAYIFGSGDFYVLRTVGDSMINAGIQPGDFVVVEETEKAEIGDIVVALTGNANTLKRLNYDEEHEEYVLHPENDQMKDIRVKDLKVQGVARFVIKSL